MNRLFNAVKRLFGKKKATIPNVAKDCACYILITCNEPGDDGDMQVEMTCEGDENLIEYLIGNVQTLFKDQEAK